MLNCVFHISSPEPESHRRAYSIPMRRRPLSLVHDIKTSSSPKQLRQSKPTNLSLFGSHDQDLLGSHDQDGHHAHIW